MTALRVLSYDEVEPFSFKLPAMKHCDFNRGDRFQTVAIDENDRLVGRWSFEPLNGAGGEISSCHTWVSNNRRREGIAIRLWRAGVERWTPWKISLALGSWEGAALAARITVEFAGTVKIVIRNTDLTPTYERLLADAALREVVRTRASDKPARRLEVVS